MELARCQVAVVIAFSHPLGPRNLPTLAFSAFSPSQALGLARLFGERWPLSSKVFSPALALCQVGWRLFNLPAPYGFKAPRCTHEGDAESTREENDSGHSSASCSLRQMRAYDPGRTRTCNPRLRRPMPYPLGHGACDARARTMPSGVLPPSNTCQSQRICLSFPSCSFHDPAT